MLRPAPVFGIALVFLFVICLTAQAQNPVAKTPEEKSRKTRREDNRAFRDWPKTDVKLIITAEEEEAYNKLKTNEERENFIDSFWRRRDPSPDTEENEYREQYYERITYANEHFSSGKPGWLTDRGRIYVKWGKPDEIETHPAGAQIQSISYEGPAFPFEVWFYRYLPGVGSGIEIEFVDPTGSGEYRVARNPFEKEAGPFSRTREGANGIGDPNSNSQRWAPFSVMSVLKDLEAAPPVPSQPDGTGAIPRPVADDNVLRFEVKPYYFFNSDGSATAAFTVQTDNRELVFQNSGGLQIAKLNIFGRVWSVQQRKLGSFEDTVTTTATAEELADALERQSVYGKAMILQPGKYRLDLLVRDVYSGALGTEQVAFTVPKLDSTKLQVSSIVLAARLESLKDQAGVNQFAIGRTKVVPNISGVYHAGNPVGVYLQVYNAATDQTTLRPSVDVEYVLRKDGKEIQRQTEDWVGMSEAGQKLTLARLFDTTGLTPGNYDLQVQIHDHVTGQTLTPATSFTLIK
jgi:GWxTD domain-containing protein